MDKTSVLHPSMIELPLKLPGRIFRSPMPYNARDPEGKLIEQYQDKHINLIVMLLDIDETIRVTGVDLRTIYQEMGFEISCFPIPDFGVPPIESLQIMIDQTLKEALSGKNILVHCNGGLGRTGMFLACFAKRVLNLSGEKAVSWIREWIPGAIETEAQYQMVLDC
jgi:protein-tyrosine phosphatase